MPIIHNDLWSAHHHTRWLSATLEIELKTASRDYPGHRFCSRQSTLCFEATERQMCNSTVCHICIQE